MSYTVEFEESLIFKLEDVRYIHPDLPTVYGKDDTVYSSKETI